MRKHMFFLRFYGRSDDEIRQCLEEIKTLGISPVTYRIVDARISCNFFVPPEYHPVRELRLYFNTLEEAKALQARDDAKGIYHKWSMKNRPQEAEAVVRVPREVAFGL